jgi:Amidohydrolase family
VTAESGGESGAFDLALTGARVIDPETGLDGVRNVGIRGGRIAAVTTEPVTGRRAVDVSGLLLAPGFVDMHSHAQTRAGLSLQAFDGVTTALDLEMGAVDVEAQLTRAEQEGRPLNFGFSASWLLARMSLLDGLPEAEPMAMFAAGQSGTGWQAPLNDPDRLLGHLQGELAAGGIGIGVLLGYAPETEAAEYLQVAELAAGSGVPTFTHGRHLSTVPPRDVVAAVQEVVSAAERTGAHMHVCHLNSSSLRLIERTAAIIEQARGRGARVSAEAYPYGSSATVVGAPFLAPEALGAIGVEPRGIRDLTTGRFLRDAEEVRALRLAAPETLVAVQWLPDPEGADRDVLLRSLLLPDTVLASDALPVTLPEGADPAVGWPLPPGARTHPRSAGCFGRYFSWVQRELGAVDLREALRRCSLLPAQILEATVPAMRRKGRVQVGADADLVVLDAQTFADRATDDVVAPSVGVRHLLVGGTFVIEDGILDVSSRAGCPVRGGRA